MEIKVSRKDSLGIACLPLVRNIPNANEGWKKTKCQRCGCDCWETDTYHWAKQAGIVGKALCTECALKQR